MPNITGLILNGAGVVNAAGNNVGALEHITGIATGAADTWATPITLFGPTTINTDVGALTLSGVISGAADLIKIGGGTLALTTSGNTYTGETSVGTASVNGGILQFTIANSLGALTGGVIVNSGSTLQINAGITVVGKKLTLNGTGLGLSLSGILASTGALLLTTANSVWTGEINLATASTITTSPQVTVSGALTGAGSLTKLGAAALISQANNTYTGSTTVTVGTLALNAAGSLLTTASILVNVNSGGTDASLTLDNNINNLGGSTWGTNLPRPHRRQHPDHAQRRQLWTYLGTSAPGVISTETLGSVANPLRLTGGNSVIVSQTGNNIAGFAAPAVQITIPALVRSTGATVNFFAGGAAGTNQPLGTTNAFLIGTISLNGAAPVAPALALDNSILPWATVQTLGNTVYDYATYYPSAANGLVGLVALPLANYQTTLAGAGPTSNVRLTGNETLTGNLTVNSLILVGAGGNTTVTPTLTGPPASAFTLTIASGGLMATGGNTLTFAAGGTLNFGSAEGIIIGNNSNLTINSPITGTGGLTISQAANTATLTANDTYTSSSVQTLAFGGTITGGSFQLTFNSATTGAINWSPNAATLVANIQAALDVLSTIGAGNTIVAGTGTGPYSITFRNALANAPEPALALAANALTGTSPTVTAAVVDTGSSITTIVNGPGTLAVNSLTALSSGAVDLLGGTFNTTIAAIANPLIFADNSVVTLGSTATYTGPITLGSTAGAMVSLNIGGGPVALAGTISGPDSLNVFAGGGQLILNGANTYSGGTNLDASTILATTSSAVNGSTIVSGSLGTGPINLTGGTLEGSGTVLNSGAAAVNLANPINLINAGNAPVGPFAAAITGLFGTTLTLSGNVTVAGTTNQITEGHTGVPITASSQTLTFNNIGSNVLNQTFTLSLFGATTGSILWNAAGTNFLTLVANIQSALNTLLGAGTTLVSFVTATANTAVLNVAFTGTLANAAQPLLVATTGTLAGGAPQVAGVGQTLTFSNVADDALNQQFTLSFNGTATGAINYDPGFTLGVPNLVSNIQNALDTLVGIGNTVVSLTNTTATTTVITVTFIGTLASPGQQLMTAQNINLGSGAPAIGQHRRRPVRRPDRAGRQFQRRHQRHRRLDHRRADRGQQQRHCRRHQCGEPDDHDERRAWPVCW